MCGTVVRTARFAWGVVREGGLWGLVLVLRLLGVCGGVGGGGWALELCGTALCLLSVVRLGGFVHASYVSIRCMLVSMHGSRLGAR
jgi:hypothetical protein